MKLSFQEYEFDEIKKIIKKWTWQEIRYGYHQSFISKEEVVAFAKESLAEDIPELDIVMELAIRNPDECIENDLQLLCNNEKNEEKGEIRSKWLYAILSCLFEKKTQIDNIQLIIDNIYVDFEYPEEIADLVSYMPYCGDRGESLEKRLEEYLTQGINKYCYDNESKRN